MSRSMRSKSPCYNKYSASDNEASKNFGGCGRKNHRPQSRAQKYSKLYIGKGSEFWMTPNHPNIQWKSVDKIQMNEVHSCYVSQLVEEEIPSFKYPSLVHDIHFDGVVTQRGFDKLVLPLANLKLLEIHLSTLEHLSIGKKCYISNEYLKIQSLEAIQISGHHVTELMLEKCNYKRILDNIVAITGITFPKLHYIAFNFPIVGSREEELISCIFKFIANHRQSLKSLSLETPFDISGENDSLSNMEELFDVKFLLKNMSSLSVTLESFHYFTNKNGLFTEVLRKFCQTQTKLKYFNFWCLEKYYPFPIDVIFGNTSTLHTIAVNITPLKPSSSASKSKSHEPIDFVLFQGCPCLTTLVLKGEPNDLLRLQPDIINTKNAPKSLVTLRLISLTISTQNAKFLVSGLPLLQNLYLEDIGEYGDFGIAIDDVACLFGRSHHHLMSIHIRGSINYNSLTQSSSVKITEQACENELITAGYKVLTTLLLKGQQMSNIRANFVEELDRYETILDLDSEDDEQDTFYNNAFSDEDETSTENGN